MWEIRGGDSLALAREIPENSIDCICTDPPAGISFCSKGWDSDKGGRKEWIAWLSSIMKEALRAVKPGGYALVWAIPRTSHWTATALEDAGWRVADIITHHYGSGFPKGLDIGKAMDKTRDDDLYHVTAFVREARDRAELANSDIDAHFGFKGMGGHWTSDKQQPAVPSWEYWLKLKELLQFGDEMDAEVLRLNDRKGRPAETWFDREVIGRDTTGVDGHIFRKGGANPTYHKEFDITAPATEDAQKWDGWNTSLKPGSEHWILAQKPIAAKNIAKNVLKFGVGGLNIRGCEIRRAEGDVPGWHQSGADGSAGYLGTDTFKISAQTPEEIQERRGGRGRWPSNVVFSHSAACECVGVRKIKGCPKTVKQGGVEWSNYRGSGGDRDTTFEGYGDEDGMELVEVWECAPDCPVTELEQLCPGASRYFYVAKPTREEKEAGCDQLPLKVLNRVNSGGLENDPRWKPLEVRNNHPTVKGINLMRWLCRLICPPGGVVWDLFCGSGTTGCAAVMEGFSFLGFEQEPESVEIAKARVAYWSAKSGNAAEEVASGRLEPRMVLEMVREGAQPVRKAPRAKPEPVGQPALF